MHLLRQMNCILVKHKLSIIMFLLMLFSVLATESEGMTKMDSMQQVSLISFGLTGKMYNIKSGSPCFREIENKVSGLLETSNDTFDTILNTRQINEWKKEKDWVEIRFSDEKNLRIGHLRQNAMVETIMIFFKDVKPEYILWGNKGFSPTQANIAANTLADQSLHDDLLKCRK